MIIYFPYINFSGVPITSTSFTVMSKERTYAAVPIAAIARSKHLLLAVLCLLLLAVLYEGYDTSYTFLNRQQNSSPTINTHCYGDDSKSTFCNNNNNSSKGNEIQFSRFVWFVTDGYPARFSDNIFNHYQDNTILYHVTVPGAKYSHAIYTSWLTGQLPTNYQGKPINGDNILDSMKRSPVDYKLHYVGPEWSFLGISGKERYDELYDKIDIRNEPLDEHYMHAYPGFFETPELKKDFMYDFCLTWSSKIEVLLRTPPYPRVLNSWGNNIAKDMVEMKDWIDENPEYLLLVTSDHGTDEYLLSGYTMHGSSEKGNNGYVMLYNPRLPKGVHAEKIDVVDVCPTITQYLKGVDIPLHSVGRTRAYFGPKKPTEYGNALKRNIHQLRENLRESNLISSAIETEISVVLDQPIKDNAAISRLQQSADDLKFLLYNTVVSPWSQVVWVAGIVLAIVFLLIGLNYGWGLRSFIREIRKGMTWKMMGICSLCFLAPCINLLVPLSQFGKVFRTGTSFFLPVSGIGITLLYLSGVRAVQSNSNTARTNWSNLFSLVFTNELVNWTSLSITLVAKQSWKIVLREFPLSRDIVYIGTFVLMRRMIPNEPPGKVWRVFNPRKTLFIMFWVCRVYELTEEIVPLYFAFEFHVLFALMVVSSVAFLIGNIILPYTSCWGKGKDGERKLVVARLQSFLLVLVNFILWLLWMDSPSGQLILLLFNIQFHTLLAPVLSASVVAASWDDKGELSRDTNEAPTPTQRCSTAISASFTCNAVMHLCVAYFVAQAYFHFSVPVGDRMNLNVHPYVGKTGMRGFDTFPILSGVWMGTHKFGVFGLLAIYSWRSISPSIERPTLKARQALSLVCQQWSLLLQLALYFFTARLGMLLLLCFYQNGMQPLEESVVYVGSNAIVCLTFLSVFAVDVALRVLSEPPPELFVNPHEEREQELPFDHDVRPNLGSAVRRRNASSPEPTPL